MEESEALLAMEEVEIEELAERLRANDDLLKDFGESKLELLIILIISRSQALIRYFIESMMHKRDSDVALTSFLRLLKRCDKDKESS